MALVLPNSVYLHAPKSGGWWVRNVVRDLGIPTLEYGHEHSHFRSGLLKCRPEGWWAHKTIFVFVRHPLSWYQSLWTFRIKHGWSMIHPLDFNCGCNDFPTFVEKVLRWWPSGWVTRTFEEFTTVPPGARLVVGRQEQLREHLGLILYGAGEISTPNPQLHTPPANESTMDGKTSGEWAACPEELKGRVLKAEVGLLRRYYQPGWEMRGPMSQ